MSKRWEVAICLASVPVFSGECFRCHRVLRLCFHLVLSLLLWLVRLCNLFYLVRNCETDKRQHSFEQCLCFHFRSLKTDDRLPACEKYLPVCCQWSRYMYSYRETDGRLHYPNHWSCSRQPCVKNTLKQTIKEFSFFSVICSFFFNQVHFIGKSSSFSVLANAFFVFYRVGEFWMFHPQKAFGHF